MWYLVKMVNPEYSNDDFTDPQEPYQLPAHDSVPSPPRLPAAELTDADPMRVLTPVDLQSPRRRRIRLPLILFLITCVSTFWAGATDWNGATVIVPTAATGISGMIMEYRVLIVRGWEQGVIYMFCVLAILLTHEMGHFIATECYRIPASLPYFIPFPISPIGTMGAVIGMEGFKANRRQIFDIGLAGPLAGLVVAVPILWIGIEHLDLGTRGHGAMAFECPWLIRLMIGSLRPEYRDVDRVWLSQLNPYFMAGWVGSLITGLNMLPVGQLDGGHVIYTLFRKRAQWIARGFLLLAITVVVIFDAYVWIPMLVLVTLIGTDHPSTSDDSVRLGWFRTLLGYASLSIPILCFPPRAFFLG